jgi:hypothetical protein
MKQFIFSPLVKFLDCAEAPLKISDVIRDRKILIVNLGTLDKDAAHLAGKLIVTKIQQAVFHQQPTDCTPHFLHADEFQNFQTSAFDVILSEARAFRLCLVLANQGLYQLDEKIRHSIFTNVTAARIAFRISHEDLSNWRHLLPSDKDAPDYIDLQRLANLPPYSAFYHVAEHPPVIKDSLAPLPPPHPKQEQIAESITNRTVEKYGCDTKADVVSLKHGIHSDTKDQKPDPTESGPPSGLPLDPGKKAGPRPPR